MKTKKSILNRLLNNETHIQALVSRKVIFLAMEEYANQFRKPVVGESLSILPPIKIIESKNYNLIIQDNSGKYYYFNDDGTCDGWSMDVNWNEN